MGISRGKKIVTEGLVLALDAANNKSYPGSGTIWYDLNKNNLDTTLYNDPTLISSSKPFNVAFEFDGTDDYAEVATDGYGIFNLQSFTIDAWVYPVDDGYTVREIIWSYDKSSHVAPYYQQNLWVEGNISGPGNLRFNSNQNNNDLTATAIVDYGEWQHFAVTKDKDNETLLLYKNGQLIAEQTSSTLPIAYESQEVWINRYNPDASTTGIRSYIKFYNLSLTNTQVLQNYNATKDRFGL